MEIALILLSAVIVALLFALMFTLYFYVQLVRKFANYLTIGKFQSLDRPEERLKMKAGVNLAGELEKLDRIVKQPPKTKMPPPPAIQETVTHTLG